MTTKEHHNCEKIIKTAQGGDREQIAAVEDTPVGASNATMNTHPTLTYYTAADDFSKLFYDGVTTAFRYDRSLSSGSSKAESSNNYRPHHSYRH